MNCKSINEATDVLNSSSAALNIDLSAIVNNYQILASSSNRADCAAVVKANAYGMGIKHVASALYHNTKCSSFFVASLREAIELRSILKDAVIYVFDGLFAGHRDLYIEHNIIPILNDISQVKLWEGTTSPCAIQFDTGINRLGLSEDETEQFLNSEFDLNLKLILSHLVRSEEPEHETNKIQLEKFKKISTSLPNIPASLCNSAGIFLGEEYHFDLLRPGIMLYGGNPGLSLLPGGIKSVFEIRGKILQVRSVDTGMSVGYNAIWTAQRPSRVALVNIGYADGYLKLYDNCGKVFVAGHVAPVIGKVSMDMIAIDVTGPDFDKVNVQDDVELLGSNITLEMVSEVSTLGHYEILTNVGQRFLRNYKIRTLT